MAALETALFESGRPLLIAPPQPPASMGEHVLIAWNCSTETARTVGFAMPLLAVAQRITVLTVQRGTVPGPSAAELAAISSGTGSRWSGARYPPGDELTGRGDPARGEGVRADLIVKGAYTQSRLRQMIFGGATSHLLGDGGTARW